MAQSRTGHGRQGQGRSAGTSASDIRPLRALRPGRSEAVLRLLGERLVYTRDEVIAQFRAGDVFQVGWRVVGVLVHHRERVATLEWQGTRGAEKQDDTDRVEIAAAIETQALALFGAHERGRSHRCANARQGALLRSCDAKIEHFDAENVVIVLIIHIDLYSSLFLVFIHCFFST